MSKAKTVGDQHAEIQFSIERLRVVAQWKNPAVDQHLRRVIDQDLTALSQMLSAHFAFEEQGGYMHWIVDTRPELQIEAQGLQRQHGQILTELKELLEQVPEAPVDDLKVAIEQVVDQLSTHEAAESAFLRVAIPAEPA